MSGAVWTLTAKNPLNRGFFVVWGAEAAGRRYFGSQQKVNA